MTSTDRPYVNHTSFQRVLHATRSIVIDSTSAVVNSATGIAKDVNFSEVIPTLMSSGYHGDVNCTLFNGTHYDGAFIDSNLTNSSSGLLLDDQLYLDNPFFFNCTVQDVSPIVPPYPLWLTILFALAAGAVSLLTVVGNFIVLLSFYLSRHIRQPSNYFILSLAVSDFTIGLISMPLYTMYRLVGYWPLGPVICDLWLSVDYTVNLAAQYTVFFITLDRFCSVKIPAKYRTWRTKGKVNVMVGVTWIVPIGVFFTSIIGWQFFMGKRTVESDQCYVQFMDNPLFNTILVICYYWITLVVICIMYAGIYKTALALHRRSAAKQKKMRTLVSMAGQTVTNIGIGVTKTVSDNTSRNQETTRSTPLLSVVVKDRGTSSINQERSSSPVYPSDVETEPSSTCDQVSKTNNGALQHSTTKGNEIDHDVRPDTDEFCTGKTGEINQTIEKDDFVNDNDIKEQLITVSDTAVVMGGSPRPKRLSIKKFDTNLNEASARAKLILSSKKSSFKSSYNQIPTNDESPVWKRRDSFEVRKHRNNHCETDIKLVLDTNQPKNKVKIKVESSPNKATPTITKVAKPVKEVSSQKKKKKKGHQSSTSSTTSVVRRLMNSVSKQDKSAQQKQKTSKSENRAKKALKTITMILGAFVLCWTPYHILAIYMGVCGSDTCVDDTLYAVSYWFCYLNSPLNPFCYALANAHFKRTFKQILRFDFRRH